MNEVHVLTLSTTTHPRALDQVLYFLVTELMSLTMTAMLSLGYGVLVGLVVIDLCRWIFPRLGLMDFPERYGLDRPRVIYPVGLGLALVSIGYLLVRPEFGGLWWPLLFLMGVSFWDDRRPLPAWVRLVVHFMCAGWVLFEGIMIDSVGHPWRDTNVFLSEMGWWLPGIVTVLWIVLVQNALNWFDSIRGSMISVASLGFLAMGVLILWRPELFWDPAQMPVARATFFLGGLCVGGSLILWRGRAILGDTGTQVLGFWLAVLAIWSGAKIATTVLVLLLPLLDVLVVCVVRFWQGKSVFEGDYQHFPHILAQRFGEVRASLLIVFMTFVLMAAALFLQDGAKFLAIIVFGLVFLGFEWRLRQGRFSS